MDDLAATVISPNRSVIFWEVVEVCRWFEALEFGRETIEDAREKRVNGLKLISLVNSNGLDEIGVTKLMKIQLLWNLERRIAKGDQKAGTAVDPKVFVGVSEHIAELKGRGSYRPYRDDVDPASESLMNSAPTSTARPTPLPKFVSGTGGKPEKISTRGGGVPSQGQGGEAGATGAGHEMLDLMSMDMGTTRGEGGPESADSRALVPVGSGSPLETTVNATKTTTTTTGGKKKKSAGSGEKQTFNLIDLEDVEGDRRGEEAEDEDEDGGHEDEVTAEDGQQVQYSESGKGPEAVIFEVVFPPGETPNILLEESQPGNRLRVKSFPKKQSGDRGSAELCGRIEKGDFLVATNSVRLEGFAFNDAIRILTSQTYPMSLRFRRVPKHLQGHNLEEWSVNALRTVLMENGANLTGLERHSQLVAMARRAFWDKPVPLPPSPPHVEAGTAAMINGETSVCGWLLMKGPHDRVFQRLFCDLHGSELLYHKPKGTVTGDSAGYAARPAGSIDMAKVKLVATTRSSEEGHKDLRMVNEDNQVYLLSFAKEDALNQWMRKLNTSLIIGPGARTSGVREPSAPYLVSKSHNSLTVMWLPPKQPFLNTVHSFQLAYKLGINPLRDWTMATDEAHSTKFTIKGLRSGERYFTKVRAMHELDRGQMMWGEWSEHSIPFVTDREAYRPTQPAKHIWVLVHGLRGEPEEMKHLGGALSSRHGSDVRVVMARCNSAAFKTLDGINKGGTRLFEEIMQTIDSVTTAEYISFIGHGVGGMYIRYALRLLNEAGIFDGGRLSPLNLITLGTPHLGTLRCGQSVVGMMVDSETADQLAFRDAEGSRETVTRDTYGVGAATSIRRPSSGMHYQGRAEVGLKVPMLAKMTGEDYLAPLRLFLRRVLYANTKYDGTVEYPSASIRLEDPYAYVPDEDLERMCSPHYSHVIMKVEEGSDRAGGGGGGGGGAPLPHGPSGVSLPSELSAACPEPGTWEIMARVLDSVGWELVDIFNQDGLSPYKDLVVANEWLNGQGIDIVRHIVNHALNRPPETKQANALVVVAKDLITGLTDDEEQEEGKTAV